MGAPLSRDAQEIIQWLRDHGRQTHDTGDLLQGFCAVLAAHGVPVARATTHARTLHPQFRWIMRLWRRGASVEETRRRHGIETTPTFHGNPVEHVVETGQWLDQRLDDSVADRFPVYRELLRDGYTHYVMAPLRFSDNGAGAASWATDAPGGFTAAQVGLLREVADFFSLVFEIKGLRRVLTEVLSTYVGHDPAQRILAGTVQRGDVRRIRAAIMLTDLRGFGRLSDEFPEERMVELLNAHFDCIVPHVLAEGGEVLKYTGDGLLAVFDQSRSDGMPCDAAYRAARAALATLAARNAAGGFGGVALRIGVALHCGEVAYGNVGSGDRLDFTAIGRDVNIASRLERLCEPMEQPLLMTGEFVAGLSAGTVELGHFEFKGFKRHEAVYGPADGEDDRSTAVRR